jgi:hypothetical protein
MGPHSAWTGLWADDLEPGTAKDRQRQPSVKLIDLVVASDASVTIHERHDFWDSPTSHLT